MVSSASSANIIKKKDVKTTFNIYLSNRLNRNKLKRNKYKNKQFRKKKTIAFGNLVFCYFIKYTYSLNNTKVFSMVVCVDNTCYYVLRTIPIH